MSHPDVTGAPSAADLWATRLEHAAALRVHADAAWIITVERAGTVEGTTDVRAVDAIMAADRLWIRVTDPARGGAFVDELAFSPTGSAEILPGVDGGPPRAFDIPCRADGPSDCVDDAGCLYGILLVTWLAPDASAGRFPEWIPDSPGALSGSFPTDSRTMNGDQLASVARLEFAPDSTPRHRHVVDTHRTSSQLATRTKSVDYKVEVLQQVPADLDREIARVLATPRPGALTLPR